MGSDALVRFFTRFLLRSLSYSRGFGFLWFPFLTPYRLFSTVGHSQTKCLVIFPGMQLRALLFLLANDDFPNHQRVVHLWGAYRSPRSLLRLGSCQLALRRPAPMWPKPKPFNPWVGVAWVMSW